MSIVLHIDNSFLLLLEKWSSFMKKTTKIVLFLINLCSICLQFNLCLGAYNVAGTMTVLPKECQDLSLLHGAAACESDWLYNFYKFGHLSRAIVEREKGGIPPEKDRPAVEQFHKDIKNLLSQCHSSCARLVRHIFYMLPGNVKSGLAVSQKIVKKHSKVKIIDFTAKILVQLWLQNKAKSLSCPDAFFLRVSKKNIIKQNRITKASQDLIYPGYDFTRITLLSLVWKLAQKDRCLLYYYYNRLRSAFEKQQLRIQESIDSLNNTQKKLYTQKISVLFSDPKQGSIVVQKKINVLTELLSFCKKILSNFHLNEETAADWINVSFNGKTNKIMADFQLIINPQRLLDAEVMEKMAFLAFYEERQPETILLNSVEILYKNVKYQANDCFEALIRNLCNNIVYDPIKKGFSPDTILLYLKNKKNIPIEKFTSFYQKYPSCCYESQVEKMAANEWAQLTSNIPWVSYRCSADNQTCDLLGEHIYMKLPDNFQEAEKCLILEKQHNYRIKQKDACIFNMNVSFKNLIMVFNHFFNLNIDKDPQFLEYFTGPVEKFLTRYWAFVFQPFCTQDFNITAPIRDNTDGADNYSVSLFLDKKKINDQNQNYNITLSGHCGLEFEQLKKPLYPVLEYPSISHNFLSNIPTADRLSISMFIPQRTIDNFLQKQPECCALYLFNTTALQIKKTPIAASLNYFIDQIQVSDRQSFNKLLSIIQENSKNNDEQDKSMIFLLQKALSKNIISSNNKLIEEYTIKRFDDKNKNNLINNLELLNFLLLIVNHKLCNGSVFTELIESLFNNIQDCCIKAISQPQNKPNQMHYIKNPYDTIIGKIEKILQLSGHILIYPKVAELILLLLQKAKADSLVFTKILTQLINGFPYQNNNKEADLMLRLLKESSIITQAAKVVTFPRPGITKVFYYDILDLLLVCIEKKCDLELDISNDNQSFCTIVKLLYDIEKKKISEKDFNKLKDYFKKYATLLGIKKIEPNKKQQLLESFAAAVSADKAIIGSLFA
jgi:hypothetical protein